MLYIDKLKFARNEKEFQNSLFEKNGTASGYYRMRRCSIILMDHNKVVLAAIIWNRHDLKAFVNATTLDNGKKFFQFSMDGERKKFLGVPRSHLQEREYVEKGFE
mgnify:CR=1 FL=1